MDQWQKAVKKLSLSDKEIYTINKEKPNDINTLYNFIDPRSYIKEDKDIFTLFANLVFSNNNSTYPKNKKNKIILEYCLTLS